MAPKRANVAKRVTVARCCGSVDATISSNLKWNPRHNLSAALRFSPHPPRVTTNAQLRSLKIRGRVVRGWIDGRRRRTDPHGWLTLPPTTQCFKDAP